MSSAVALYTHEWNRLLDFDFENQTRQRQAYITPELRVKDSMLREQDLHQNCSGSLFDLQPVCVSTIPDATPEAAYQVANQRLPGRAALYPSRVAEVIGSILNVSRARHQLIVSIMQNGTATVTSSNCQSRESPVHFFSTTSSVLLAVPHLMCLPWPAGSVGRLLPVSATSNLQVFNLECSTRTNSAEWTLKITQNRRATVSMFLFLALRSVPPVIARYLPDLIHFGTQDQRSITTKMHDHFLSDVGHGASHTQSKETGYSRSSYAPFWTVTLPSTIQ